MILLYLKGRFRKHRNLKWLNDNSSKKGKEEIWELLKGRSAGVWHKVMLTGCVADATKAMQWLVLLSGSSYIEIR